MGNRRYERIRCQWPIELSLGRTSFRTVTDDIGLGGVFLRTDAPPPLRSLVRVEIDLDDGAGVRRLTAMATHVVEPGNPAGRAPGVGMQFYGLGNDDKRAWSQFVNRARTSVPAPRRAEDDDVVTVSAPSVGSLTEAASSREGRPALASGTGCEAVWDLALDAAPDDEDEQALEDLFGALETGEAPRSSDAAEVDGDDIPILEDEAILISDDDVLSVDDGELFDDVELPASDHPGARPLF